MAKVTEQGAKTEEENLSRTLESEARTAESFTKIGGQPERTVKPPSSITSRLDGAPEPVTVQIWREPKMPKTEFNGKANALKRLSDDGKLSKAKNPVNRDPNVTKQYRQDMIDRIYRQYHDQNPAFSDKLIDRVTRRMSPDHVHELQLGGPDTAANLHFLDRYTNEQIGLRQIWPQIKNLPDGTPIRIEVVNKK
ncbi:MAG TPA: hypothetical protein VH352_26005 [Pseudonocardiaceae bacterium]|nr:hypothetical protein [Pseudonocardiaceae bacterium]